MTQAHCRVPKCKQPIRAKQYCERHYQKWRRGELPKPRYKICKAENCRKPMVAHGFCQAHFDSWKTSRKRLVRAAAPKKTEAAAAPAAPSA
ncbi:MAG: hypothetical protein V1798_05190 [Pseudomonadota bacterium]